MVPPNLRNNLLRTGHLDLSLSIFRRQMKMVLLKTVFDNYLQFLTSPQAKREKVSLPGDILSIFHCEEAAGRASFDVGDLVVENLPSSHDKGGSNHF